MGSRNGITKERRYIMREQKIMQEYIFSGGGVKT